MGNRIDYENLTYSIMEKAGYSRNQLGRVHDSMIVGSKKFGGGDNPIFQGKVNEQDFYSDDFQVARYFEEAHDARWQCLFVKYLSKIVRVEELDHFSTLEFKEEKEHFRRVGVQNMSIDDLALQICGLLGIKPKEKSKDEKSEYDSKK